VLELAATNAALQSGLVNPLDEAILLEHRPVDASVEKIAEVPYDFVRKRLSVAIRGASGPRLITKGAFERVLAACTTVAGGGTLDEPGRNALRQQAFVTALKQYLSLLAGQAVVEGVELDAADTPLVQ
jgi:Mg2+-importing ATPase